jgi:hypothetical protein
MWRAGRVAAGALSPADAAFVRAGMAGITGITSGLGIGEAVGGVNWDDLGSTLSGIAKAWPVLGTSAAGVGFLGECVF